MRRSVRVKPDTEKMKRSLRSWLWGVPLDQEVDEGSPFTSRCGRASWSTRGMARRIAREMVLARLGDLGRLTQRA